MVQKIELGKIWIGDFWKSQVNWREKYILSIYKKVFFILEVYFEKFPHFLAKILVSAVLLQIYRPLLFQTKTSYFSYIEINFNTELEKSKTSK